MTVIVAAAVIERDGRFLVTKRAAGSHLAAYWEFPGGKCLPGEPLEACMARELLEELDVHAAVADEMFATSFEYSDRRVELHFFRCTLTSAPTPVLGQEMRWATRSELGTLAFPPADAAFIATLAEG